MESAVAFIVGTLLTVFALWVGMKFSGVHGSFFMLILIALISSLFGLIPSVGWIISLLVLFPLICKLTDARFFPDAVLMVIMAKAINAVCLLLLCQSVN